MQLLNHNFQLSLCAILSFVQLTSKLFPKLKIDIFKFVKKCPFIGSKLNMKFALIKRGNQMCFLPIHGACKT